MSKSDLAPFLQEVTGVDNQELIHQDTFEKLMTLKREIQTNPDVPCVFEREGTTEQNARILLISRDNCMYPEDLQVWNNIWNSLIVDVNNPTDTSTICQKFLSVLARN